MKNYDFKQCRRSVTEQLVNGELVGLIYGLVVKLLEHSHGIK